MALVNPPSLSLNPFRFDHFYQPNPSKPILNGQWGPPDQAEMFQKSIAGILPALGAAYEGVKGRVKADEAAAETRQIGTTPGQQVTTLGSTIYGNPPKAGVQDAGTPGVGDPGLKRAYDDPTYALIKQEEGFRDRPYNDSGSSRIGYGSDTYTTAQGEVKRVEPGVTITRDMADADLQRRVGEFQAGIRKQLPDFDLLPASTKAALTSVAYNYGSLPATVVEAAKGGNNQVLAASVAGLEANPQRRQREAALIMSSGGPQQAAAPAGVQVASIGPTGGAPAAAPPYDAFRAKMTEAFPQLRITSESRSPEHNRAVGGASGSQHLSGRAMDVSVRGMNDFQKQEVLNYAIQNGARGIGYYPKSDSFHFDVRPGAYAAWGPDYRSTSLNQTPPWFQATAASLTSSNSPGTGVSSQVAGGNPPPNQPQPLAGSPYDATKPVPPNQQIQPMPGQNPAAAAPSQVAQPQQRPAQPQQAQFDPIGLQPPPPSAQAGPGGPQQASQAPPQTPVAPLQQGRVQVASADPGFVPGGPAPGPGIAIDPATGQRQAVDANGRPIAAAPPPPPPQPQGVQTATATPQRPAVTPATPQQIVQTAAQVDPHYRNALAAAIESRDPTVMRGVLEAGEKLLGGKDQFDFVNGPDGNMYRVNKRTGVPELAIKGAGKPTELKEINGVTHEWDGQRWVPRAGGTQKAPETKDINGVTHQWDGSKWVAMPSGPAEWRNATPEERQAAGVTDAGPMQVNTRTGEIKFPGKSSGTNVNVNNAGETQEAKTLGEGYAKEQLDLTKASEAAVPTIARISRIRQLLETTQQGKLSPAISTIGLWAKAAGISEQTLKDLNIDPTAAANAQSAEALMGRFMTDMLQSGQFPSANFSNADKDTLQSMIPRISNDPNANKVLLEVIEEGAKRSVAKQKMWYAARAKGKTWAQFQEEWFDKIERSPNFFQESGSSAIELEIGPDGRLRRKP